MFKILVGVLLAVGFLRVAYPLWVNHYGTINADSATYTSFSRSIAQGNFSFKSVLWDFIGERSRTGEVHPGIVWNTHILKDGTVACTVAVGYPLFLALMYLMGGTWLLLHSNLLLLYLSLIGAFLFIRESYKRGINGTIFAGISTLFVVMLNPTTFNQFSYPWREALFYTLILFGLFFVCRLIKGGRFWWVIPAGLLLGYACAVKEANIIYSFAIGVAVIIDKRFWRRKDKKFLIILGIASFGFGIMPLFIQNIYGTGNPLVSLQAIRATASYGNDTWADGMNPHNAHDTIRNYINLYKNMRFFSMPFLFLALLGATVAVVRSFSGRAVFLCVVLHLLLYLQWGNADLRHMSFMNYFYAFFLIYGIYFVIEMFSSFIGSKNYKEWFISIAGIIMLAGYILKADPYETKPAQLDYKNMKALCAQIEDSIPDPENAIVFVNRLLLEQLGAYTELNIIRYHDLMRLMDPTDMMTYFNTNNIRLYFIDNTDKDPKHQGTYDWSYDDYKLLSQFYNLKRINTIDNKKYNAFNITARDKLSLYELNQWSDPVFSKTVPVPEKPLKFLYFDKKGIDGDLILSINNIILDSGESNYIPIDHLELSDSSVVVSCRQKDGSPIFASTDVKLIGENDSINLEYVLKLYGGQKASAEIPMSCGSNGVSVVYADITMIRRGQYKPLPVRVNGKPIKSVFQKPVYIYCFNSFDHDKSYIYNLEFENAMKVPVRLDSFISSAAYTNIEVSLNEESVSSFNVIPDSNEAEGDIQVEIGAYKSISLKHGRMPQGFVLTALEAINSNDVANVRVHNGFIMDYETMEVDFPFLFMPKSLHVGVTEDLYYKIEEDVTGVFRWTMGEFKFILPVKQGRHRYLLKLKARDGFVNPGTRPLLISVDKQMVETTLTAELNEYEFEFQIESGEEKLIPFSMSISPWIPAEVLGVRDERELGFMFYGFEWREMR